MRECVSEYRDISGYLRERLPEHRYAQLSTGAVCVWCSDFKPIVRENFSGKIEEPNGITGPAVILISCSHWGLFPA